MVKPTVAELSMGNKYNRYVLVMMAAKGAKYVIERENYEKEHPQNDVFAFTEPELVHIDYNNKPVTNAIKLFHDGDMFIKLPPEAQQASDDHMAQCKASEMLEEN